MFFRQIGVNVVENHLHRILAAHIIYVESRWLESSVVAAGPSVSLNSVYDRNFLEGRVKSKEKRARADVDEETRAGLRRSFLSDPDELVDTYPNDVFVASLDRLN